MIGSSEMSKNSSSVPNPVLGGAASMLTPAFSSVVASGVPANGSGTTVV